MNVSGWNNLSKTICRKSQGFFLLKARDELKLDEEAASGEPGTGGPKGKGKVNGKGKGRERFLAIANFG